MRENLGRWMTVALWCFVLPGMLAVESAADIPPNTGDPMVRVVYVIPSNRTARPYAVPNLTTMVRVVHSWYAEEMEKWGYGRKSFRYETETDGVTPKIHVLHVPEPDTWFQNWDVFGRTVDACVAQGLPAWEDGECWIFVNECHAMLDDKTITGTTAQGGGGSLGDGYAGGFGVATVGSATLKFASMGSLLDTTLYDGVIDPDVGPYPMEFGVTWAWFLGDSFGSLGSCLIGAMGHELGHALGLPHDFRGDANFNGNLMGNGLRGMWGCIYPDIYPNDYVRLSYSSAMTLNLSPYFTTEMPAPPVTSFGVDPLMTTAITPAVKLLARAADLREIDSGPAVDDIISFGQSPRITAATTDPRPNVTPMTSGSVSLTNGKIRIEFGATDPDGLVFATLRWPGLDRVDEIELSGAQVVLGAFETPYYDWPHYETSDDNPFLIRVFDNTGDSRGVTVDIDPDYVTGANQAPRPQLHVDRQVTVGDRMATFNAEGTEDRDDGTNNLTYEWDLDGDGIYEKGPYASPTVSGSFPTSGLRKVRLRVSDGFDSHESPWVTVLVVPRDPADSNCDDLVDVFDIDPFVMALTNPDAFSDTFPYCSIWNCDVNVDGAIDVFDIDPFVEALVN